MKKNNTELQINSILGKDAEFVGDLFVKDTTRVDGTIRGNITSEGTVIVGTNGKVEGNIKAENVSVAGVVKGDISTTGKIEAAASAHIIGNIATKSLVIDENAIFQGNCNMKAEEPAQTQAKPVVEEAVEEN